MRFKPLSLLALCLLLMACAGSNEDRYSSSPREAALHPELYQGASLRWSGVVMALEHREGESWLEILSYPSGQDGAPILTAPSQGRFQVRSRGYLEPRDFSRGRPVTIIGRMVELRSGELGGNPVNFPLLQMERYALWEKQQQKLSPDLHFGIGIGFGF